MEYHELAKGIFLVGNHSQSSFLQENCFLIIRNQRAIMIDPNPLPQFDEAFQTITSLIPLECIDSIIVHHQDPDICSSLKAWEDAGFQGEYLASWRTALFLPALNLQNTIQSIPLGKQSLQWQGLDFQFIFTPYLHAPGAMMTFLSQEKILFSSDLLGSLGAPKNQLWYAPENFHKVSVMHQYYMPSTSILHPVLDKMLNLNASFIFPQHGLLYKEHISEVLTSLKGIPCGGLIQLNQSGSISFKGKDFDIVFHDLFSKIQTLLSVNEWDAFNSRFKNVTLSLASLADASSLYNDIEEYFQETKNKTYAILLPVFMSEILQKHRITSFFLHRFFSEDSSEKISAIFKENIQFNKEKYNLLENLIRANDDMYTDALTGFYNEDFFLQCVTSLDAEHGTKEGDIALKTLGQVLLNLQISGAHIFRLSGPVFLCIQSIDTVNSVIDLADTMRLAVKESSLFLKPSTVSIAIVENDELDASESTHYDAAKDLLKIGKKRLALLDAMGSDSVCSRDNLPSIKISQGHILLLFEKGAEEEIIHRDLEDLGFEVTSVDKGVRALELIKDIVPNLIIATLHLPQMSAFQIRQEMLQSSALRTIPMILTDYQKTEDNVRRAHALSIYHYLKKPFILAELIGLAKALATSPRQGNYHD